MREKAANDHQADGEGCLNQPRGLIARSLSEENRTERKRHDEKSALQVGEADPEDRQGEQCRRRDHAAGRPARGEEGDEHRGEQDVSVAFVGENFSSEGGDSCGKGPLISSR